MLDALTPNPTLDEQVYTRLRQAIVEGHFEPGQDLVVTTVAAQLGVSRIPVMHACQRLVGEGFLIANPRRSLAVAPLTEARILEMFEVLVALECVALLHVAEQATEELIGRLEELNDEVRRFRREPGVQGVNMTDYRFHAFTWEAAGRPYLFQQIRTVYDHYEPARVLSRGQHNPIRSAEEHARIVDALRRHDAAAAQNALRVHREQSVQRALAALRAREAGRSGRPGH
ncbi:MAG: GntR family transcriptional regulator [Chloroflexi bacterium]|nr:GntR family transcriptional regulator [Chloroflexota bacterium]